ncbi:phage holin family protein [Streptomyces sp. SBT349]|uniref:phage holin family protein n=1 Tax=Streptomyces sp. SBT349 TaxID=1580539 RepID=UPI00066D6ADD|nr:phage holin family protein [Streptomyces sp. SBT349]
MSLTSRRVAQRTEHPGERNGSVRETLAEITTDTQRLFRQEIELAKAELRQEAASAGKAAGLFGGAGFAAWMVVVFASLALAFGLANVMDAGWAALIVAGAWAVIGTGLFLVGRTRARNVSLTPRATKDTLKEDARWARHPNA